MPENEHGTSIVDSAAHFPQVMESGTPQPKREATLAAE
ncbi:MAG: hypothetical protein RLY70_616 [Planctomycetota bacterium]|jgi:hypothetical protein